MGQLKWMDGVSRIWGKYKYALIVLALGILLMLLPGKNNEETAIQQTLPASGKTITEELTGILEQIRGVGKVRLMLTVDAGEETLYQFDEDRNLGDNGSVRTETVIVTDASRQETGLIRQILPASYRGAVVVCEGGDQASVCLSVIQAVSKVTGLSSDKITVLKMK